MKKILIIFNDYHMPASVVDYAIQLAQQRGATLFGLFVQSLEYHDDSYFYPNDMNLTDTDLTAASDKEEHLQFLSNSTQSFADRCTAAGTPFATHVINTEYIDALIDHSAFADLIICGADHAPQQYSLSTLLANAHCPALLINDDYTQTNTLVFTYDDKLSSIDAVKRFTYLFDFYNDLPVHFVSVLPTNVIGLEYEDLIEEWLPLHYPNATIEILKGDTKDELINYINGLSNPLIVMGAFGRSMLSRFFKESLANTIMKQTNAPVFIAHH